MKKVKERKETAKLKIDQRRELLDELDSIDSRVLMIQTLIPLGLKTVEDMLQEEVCRLAGQPYSRGGVNKRWGTNPGSVRGAKQKLTSIRKELEPINQSAVGSLDEGLEETLTLRKLGLFNELGRSFKTTNCIEYINRQLGIYTDRVTCWKNSNQRQRWSSAALFEIEPKLIKVYGYRHPPKLRQAMKVFTKNQNTSKGVDPVLCCG